MLDEDARQAAAFILRRTLLQFDISVPISWSRVAADAAIDAFLKTRGEPVPPATER